ncbi:hypothetical protein GCM10010349_70390 [Streptomyces flavofungini]|nr:hypothetical protein GCM10010349_70390 [Streptomyces flavofungini]
MPGSNFSVVADAKDLKPRSVMALRCTPRDSTFLGEFTEERATSFTAEGAGHIRCKAPHGHGGGQGPGTGAGKERRDAEASLADLSDLSRISRIYSIKQISLVQRLMTGSLTTRGRKVRCRGLEVAWVR